MPSTNQNLQMGALSGLQLPNTLQASLNNNRISGIEYLQNVMQGYREDTRNQFGYSPIDRDYARNTLAALYRENYSDYVNRFRPIQDILYEMASPSFSQDQGTTSSALFTENYDRGQQAASRQVQSLGLNPSEEQNRLSQQKRTLGQVQAYNQAQRGASDLSALALGVSPRNNIIPEGV